jgi:hypothetical protein
MYTCRAPEVAGMHIEPRMLCRRLRSGKDIMYGTACPAAREAPRYVVWAAISSSI